MKTVSGHCESSKEISLSKAAKILSKFVSADNGASHVISAYLHRASAAFNELKQLHKELNSSHSHNKKHKKHKIETGDDDRGGVVDNSVRSVDTNQELNNSRVKSKNDFGRQQFGREYADEGDRKSTQAVFKFSEELNGSVGDLAGNVGGSGGEKHKNKKKKQEVESRLDGNGRLEFREREGDGKMPSKEQNEIASGQDQGNEVDNNPGLEEGKKQKKDKKKHTNLEGENAKGQEQQKEIEKKLSNGVEGENGVLVGPQEIRKKKKHEAGSGNRLYAEEVKMEQRKKRKFEDVEDRSGDLTEKRMRRIHEG